MPALEHLPASADPQTLCAVVRRDGAAIIDGALDAAALERLRSEIMPYVDATPPGRDDFTGRHTTRTGALAARSAACRDLILHGTVLNAARAFLASWCDTIQLHLTQLIRIREGQAAQPLHRDRLAWGGFLPAEIEPQFNTIWAVSDFTAGNGATQVVPGSQAWDPKRRAEPHEITRAEMAAGSVLVYSGSVIHGGGAHAGGVDRLGLNITYCLGWLRQEENQYLSCPPAIAKDFPAELQALLGYAMGSYALGYYTPPVGPGDGPECVPPTTMFGEGDNAWGGQAMLDAVSARAADGAM